MGRLKHPHKGIKMDRTTENIATLVPPEIMKHYKEIHLDIDIPYVNNIAFLLAIAQDIGSMHCKSMTSSVTKRIQNALKQITLNYQARGFKIVTAFGDGAFEQLDEE